MSKYRWRNTVFAYGLFTIINHWLMALLIIALYWLGDYMVGLDYYNPWYNSAPWWHKSFGMLVLLLLVLRFVNLALQVKPHALASHTPWERLSASLIQWCFYVLMLLIVASGYMITTANGKGVDVFGAFIWPAIIELRESGVELAGEIHKYASVILILLLVLHVSASLKHHFIDRDTTLLRIIKPVNCEDDNND